METLSVNKKNQKDVTDAIKKYAASNTLFHMVCKKFTERVRNRNHITAAALKLTMSKDDLNFPLEKYYEILEFLGKLGLGKIVANSAGKVIELTHIPVSLQSIGQIVHGYGPTEPPPVPQAARPAILEDHTRYTTTLTVMIRGNAVTFPGPDTDAENLVTLLVNFANLLKSKK